MTLKFVKAALMALAVTGLFALPIQESAAATKCKETIVNGRVVKRVCTTTHKPKYRKVCDTYWRHGVKHTTCRKVRVY